MKYENHPYAEVWPSLEGDAFDRLVADIKANGQRLPIILYDDKILDGRNRDRACGILGIEPRYETYTGTDEQARALVRSLNEHRRHLTAEQRHAAVENLHKASPEKSIRQMAEETGVSKSTVDRVLKDNTLPVPMGHLEQTKGKDGKTYRSRTLSPEEKADRDDQIRKAHASGKTYNQILRDFSVSNQTIANAIRGKHGQPAKRSAAKPPVKTRATLDNSLRARALPALTREQVDPEFTGTPMEWVDKYGHIQLETAEQRATSRFNDWAIEIGHLAKVARGQPSLPDVDLNWLRSPKDSDVRRMCEALEILEPLIERAKQLLERATQGKCTANGHDKEDLHGEREAGA